MTDTRVLGVDLASSKWSNNGSALLSFVPGRWTGLVAPSIMWPGGVLTAKGMAAAIDSYCTSKDVAAVSLDGPQGWRDPNAGNRKGVGRWCEYVVKAQGKTKTYGYSAPQTQIGWIEFCIDVFAELLACGNAVLANDAKNLKLQPQPKGNYWLLECFPTSVWRASGLSPLPGKQKVGKNQALIGQYAASLAQAYGLPVALPFPGTHDDLQAIVCALPAAGLLGGPAVPIPKGFPASVQPAQGNIPSHRIEGLIWDARPVGGAAVKANAAAAQSNQLPPESVVNSSIAIDDRDDATDAMLKRGVRLFRHLVSQANAGACVGIGYADFACFVHGVANFKDIAGRSYKPSDSPYVVGLALQVTEAADGRLNVTIHGQTIDAGMDTFVWPKARPHERADVAFLSTPYTQDEWKKVFPAAKRRMLGKAELAALRN